MWVCGSVCLSARVCVYLQEYARMRPKIKSLSRYTFLQNYDERIMLLVVLSMCVREREKKYIKEKEKRAR